MVKETFADEVRNLYVVLGADSVRKSRRSCSTGNVVGRLGESNIAKRCRSLHVHEFGKKPPAAAPIFGFKANSKVVLSHIVG